MSEQLRGPTDIRSVVLPIRAPVRCWFSSGAAAVGAPLACAFRQQCHHMYIQYHTHSFMSITDVRIFCTGILRA